MMDTPPILNNYAFIMSKIKHQRKQKSEGAFSMYCYRLEILSRVFLSSTVLQRSSISCRCKLSNRLAVYRFNQFIREGVIKRSGSFINMENIKSSILLCSMDRKSFIRLRFLISISILNHSF